jgi:hypothetical protein
MFDYSKILSAIAQAAPIIGQAPALVGLFEDVIEGFGGKHQDDLKEALADARADNDEGHRRLQQKLTAAAGGN